LNNKFLLDLDLEACGIWLGDEGLDEEEGVRPPGLFSFNVVLSLLDLAFPLLPLGVGLLLLLGVMVGV